MSLSDSQTHLGVEVSGEVARKTEGGLAIEFEEIDVESVEHLHNLVLYNSDNPEEVEHEFAEHMGIKHRDEGALG